MDVHATTDLASVGTAALTRTLIERMSKLVHAEIELAKTEAILDLKKGKVAGELGGGAIAALVAAICCALIAAVDGLSYLMPTWLAALLLLVVFAGVAAGLGFGAYKEVMSAAPKRSLREAKATFRMLTERHV